MPTKHNKQKSRKHNQSNCLFGTFGEQYEVSLDYQKPDGYWVCSHIELVRVPVTHGVNEKNNHAEAEAIAKQLYPKCKINSVTYC